VLFGVRGLGGAIKCLNLSKNPITLTLVVSKKLNEKSKHLLQKAKKTVKVIDNSGSKENIEFYKSSNKILYKAGDVDMALDVDIMHLYKFYEPLFGCNFSSCLGKNIFVDRDGKVHFCPKYPEKSIVGTLDSAKDYFKADTFIDTLNNAVEKRKQCKNDCKYYEYCGGACPLQDGCSDFPELFEKNSVCIDKIIKNGEDLAKQSYTVAKIVIKDIAYDN
jgi:radical SAM protein with 4Fe4S-binding SPASM domain